ncbi:MAG: hypothetical protein ACPLVI_06060 [Thermoplasmata archaeon]|jgi:molybdopterin converting factor small subunit|nr:hypothetical protein [Thermoplasmatales archaeon]PMP75621.1 MAG: hypothetical protein C0180_00890 [Aciduliprofundum sp.]
MGEFVDEWAEEIRGMMDAIGAYGDPDFKNVREIIEQYLKKHEKLELEKYKIELIVNRIIKSFEVKNTLDRYEEKAEK